MLITLFMKWSWESVYYCYFNSSNSIPILIDEIIVLDSCSDISQLCLRSIAFICNNLKEYNDNTLSKSEKEFFYVSNHLFINSSQKKAYLLYPHVYFNDCWKHYKNHISSSYSMYQWSKKSTLSQRYKTTQTQSTLYLSLFLFPQMMSLNPSRMKSLLHDEVARKWWQI